MSVEILDSYGIKWNQEQKNIGLTGFRISRSLHYSWMVIMKIMIDWMLCQYLNGMEEMFTL